MGNKYSYTFFIDDPCSEDWQKMSVSDKGRFCQSCQKQVVDFSVLSDQEIIQLIERSSGKVCGRFKSTQLNRSMELSYNVSRPAALRTILAGIVLLTVVAPSDLRAHQLPQSNPIQIVPASKPLVVVQDTSSYRYKGKIEWTDSLNLSGRDFKVSIFNDSSVVVPDETGYFELPVPDTLHNKTYTIVVNYADVMVKHFDINGANTDYTQQHVIPYDFFHQPTKLVSIVAGGLTYTKVEVKKDKKKRKKQKQ